MRFLPKNIPPESIYTTHTIPPQCAAYIFPFARPAITIVPGAFIIDQEITVKGCRMSSHGFLVEKSLEVQPTVEEDTSTIHCMMKGNATCELEGYGKVMLYSGQFNIFQIGLQNHGAKFAPGYHESWHADYNLDFLRELAPTSAVIRKLVEKAENKQSAQVMEQPGIMFSKMYTDIYELRNTQIISAITEERIFHSLGVLITEALEERIIQKGQHQNPVQQLFYTIKSYIDANLDEELSLRQLASTYAMSPSTLKTRFKEYFGITIGAYIVQQRLIEGKKLLETSFLSIEHIAYKVGYETLASFSRAFKEYFGHSPIRDRITR